MRRETFKFCDLVWLIFEILQCIYLVSCLLTCRASFQGWYDPGIRDQGPIQSWWAYNWNLTKNLFVIMTLQIQASRKSHGSSAVMMGNIVPWSNHYFSSESNMNLTRFWLWAYKPFVNNPVKFQPSAMNFIYFHNMHTVSGDLGLCSWVVDLFYRNGCRHDGYKVLWYIYMLTLCNTYSIRYLCPIWNKPGVGVTKPISSILHVIIFPIFHHC